MGQSMEEVRQWLNSSKSKGMALGLPNTKAALDRLNLHFDNTHIFHVAGSNGKGTTCAILAASLQLSGQSTVLFSSPHVSRIEERIRIDGKPISSDLFDSALAEVQQISLEKPQIELTFFEITYLCAMVTASTHNVSVLILETGLGGRLDATRTAPADTCIITSISPEHTDILGDDICKIAREKVAIARPGIKIIIRNPENDEVKSAMREECQSAGNIELGETPLPAQPIFIEIPQMVTTRQEAAILVDQALKRNGMDTSNVWQAKNSLRWPARMQFIPAAKTGGHEFLLDGAHNPSGMERVMPEVANVIENYKIQAWSLIFATSPQQEMDNFLAPLLDYCHTNPPREIIVTAPQGGRYPGIEPQQLMNYFMSVDCDISAVEYPESALSILEDKSTFDVGLIVSLGSIYLQGNLLGLLYLDSDDDLSLLAKI
jgi:dihydrofolate synthase/folylpolyglutamate synthase